MLLTIYKNKDYEKLKYRPAVKFRNIEAHVLRHIQLTQPMRVGEDEDTGDGEDENILKKMTGGR